MNTMTAEQAEQRGRNARNEGRGPQPAWDSAIAAELAGAKVGEKTDLLKAWSNGWNAANLAAAW